ncbi:MAG: SpoIIE family protein phosphatase [Holophaga sp.]|nr:SpoIIE family protein phosphatase [Holophaga sp.]
MNFGSLKVRSILTILTIYLAVGVVTVLAFLWAAQGISGAFGQRFAEKNAQLEKERLMGPVRREVALARKLADSAALRGFCRAEEDPGPRAAGLAELESFRKAFSDRSCFFVVARSRHYYFGDPAAPAKAPRYTLEAGAVNDQWYFEALDKVDDFALHVDSSVPLGVLKVWVNVVVKDGGRKVGLAGTGVDLSAFLKDLVQGSDRSAQTIRVDPRGVLQAHPSIRYMDFNARMKDESRRMTLYQLVDSDAGRNLLRERLDRLVKGDSALESFQISVEGRRYLAAALFIKEIDWVTITLVDPSQVMGMRSFLPILGLLALSLLVTIALVSWLLNRMVLDPLARLTRSSREIAAGNYGITLPVDRDDEIGRLTRNFNYMAATIRDYTSNLEGLVEERTLALTQSNKKILDSLAYAHLIQESMLPKPADLSRHIPDHFVLFRPRDIVGGDFYACLPGERGFLLAVGDCTGHGVPGAFMSMSAGAILSQLVAKLGSADPALLLREMNGALKRLLHQGNSEPVPRGGIMDNGLDLALLKVLPDRVVFAGARLPLWVLGPGEEELTVHAGDAHSLGYRRSREDFPFRNQELPLAPGTVLYLFTDGVLDQHGGKFNFGFGRRRLGRLFQDLRGLPMAAQGEAVALALADYQGGNPQRDDITILGFRTGPAEE